MFVLSCWVCVHSCCWYIVCIAVGYTYILVDISTYVCMLVVCVFIGWVSFYWVGDSVLARISL